MMVIIMVAAKSLLILKWIILTVYVCSLLLFIPVLPEYYQTGKFLILMAGSLLLLTVWSVRTMLAGSLESPRSGITLGFTALAVVSLINLLLSVSNKVEALINPLNGIALFIALTQITYLADTYFDARMREMLKMAFLA